MSVVSSAVITDRPQRGGTRKIREEHVDNTGAKHYRQFIAAADYDEVAGLAVGAANINDSLTQSEQSQFIAAVKEGRNPFRDASNNEVTPDFNDRNAMLSIVLNHFLSLTDPVGLAPAVPYLNTLTDTELIALLSIDQATVDVIRARALDVVAIQSGIDSYVPVLGGG